MELFNFNKRGSEKTVNCEDCGILTPSIYRVGQFLEKYVCSECYKKYKRGWFLVLVAFLIAIPVIFIIIVLLFKFKAL